MTVYNNIKETSASLFPAFERMPQVFCTTLHYLTALRHTKRSSHFYWLVIVFQWNELNSLCCLQSWLKFNFAFLEKFLLFFAKLDQFQIFRSFTIAWIHCNTRSTFNWIKLSFTAEDACCSRCLCVHYSVISLTSKTWKSICLHASFLEVGVSLVKKRWLSWE
jgi:hypothetical protein